MLSSMLLAALATSAALASAPITLGYYTPFGTQPGVRLSTVYTLDKRASGRLLVSPQLAAFSRIGNHISGSAQVDLGYQSRKKERPIRATYAVGLAYLASSQIVSESLDLATGDTERSRALRHHAVPTLSYMLGQAPGHGRGWYGRLSVGHKISPQVPRSTMFALEAGLRIGGGSQ